MAHGIFLPVLRPLITDSAGHELGSASGNLDSPDPAYCTRESVAAALPEIKTTIAEQRELAERDGSDNSFGAFADRLEAEWLTLCERFDLDYGRPHT